MRRFDHEMMDAVKERMERIRDYVPSEEFDPTTALMLAKREVEPFYNSHDSTGIGTE